MQNKPLSAREHKYMACTYQMRKAQIFTQVLPRTMKEYEQRQHLQQDIMNLESSFFRGRQENNQQQNNQSFSRRLKMIKNKVQSCQASPRRDKDDTSRALSNSVVISQRPTQEHSEQESKEEVYTESSVNSDSQALKNNLKQTCVNPISDKVWPQEFQKELRGSIIESQVKWQKFLEMEEANRHRDMTKNALNWMCDKVGVLDLASLNYVRQEYMKPLDQRNLFEVDKLLSNLRFFQRFPKGVRMGILEKCSFLHLKGGQFLFKQNDIGQDMYVIVRGCVAVRQLKMTSFGKMIDTRVASLYDGNQVGDQSQVENGKICVTALATEDCYLLEMSREQYESVLIKAVEREMEQKIKKILAVSFLKQSLPVQLIPLAAVLQPKKYDMGEHLIRQDQEIPCLFFINNGSCDIVYEKRSWRETENLLISNNRTRFLFKEHLDESSSYPSKDEQSNILLKYPPNKSFDHGYKKKINNKYMEITEHIVVGELKMGDVVGGRIVFNFEKLEQKKRRNPQFEELYGKDLNIARLSVIASSCNVEVFTLDQKQFSSMPESLQSTMRNGLANLNEFDEVPVNQVKMIHQQWSTVKQGYYRSLIQQKHHRDKLLR